MRGIPNCAKCDRQPVGAGGILCSGCLALLAQRARDYWRNHPRFPRH